MRAATVVQVLHGLFYVLLQLLIVVLLSFIVSFIAGFIVVVIPRMLKIIIATIELRSCSTRLLRGERRRTERTTNTTKTRRGRPAYYSTRPATKLRIAWLITVNQHASPPYPLTPVARPDAAGEMPRLGRAGTADGAAAGGFDGRSSSGQLKKIPRSTDILTTSRSQ